MREVTWEYARQHGWTVQAVLQRIDAAIATQGSLRKAARSLGVSAAYLSDVRREKREAGLKLLGGLRLVKVVKVERHVRYLDGHSTLRRREVKS